MTVQLNLIRPPRPNEFDLRPHYTAIAGTTLHMLWRERFLIARVVAIGLAFTAIVIATVPREYTAEALIQLDFARDEAPSSAPAVPGITAAASTSHAAPAVTVEGAALAESEARLLSSRPLARKVATRLGLEKTIQDPSTYSLLHRALSSVRRSLLPEYGINLPRRKGGDSSRAPSQRGNRSTILSHGGVIHVEIAGGRRVSRKHVCSRIF